MGINDTITQFHTKSTPFTQIEIKGVELSVESNIFTIDNRNECLQDYSDM